jgi:hypothetical protein
MTVTRASLAALFLLTFPLAAQYSERVDVSIAGIDVVVRDKADKVNPLAALVIPVSYFGHESSCLDSRSSLQGRR